MNNSESIILSKKPYGEADILLSFFSKKNGKLRGIARHAKRSKKRFGGILETGYVVNIQYQQTASSGLCKIDQASLVIPTVHRTLSLGESHALWLSVELAERFLADNDSSEEKYELLKRFTTAIYEKRLSRGVVLYFLYKWISLCGYLPDFESCVKCGLHGNDLTQFSATLSGMVCRGCADGASLGYIFDGQSVPVLKRIVSGDIKFDINDKIYDDLLQFIFRYSLIILGRSLKLEVFQPMLMEIKS